MTHESFNEIKRVILKDYSSGKIDVNKASQLLAHLAELNKMV